MSRPNGPTSSSDDANETVSDIQKTRRKAPWTKQFRRATLVVLGTLSFVLFLYLMLLKARGAAIPYVDIFLVLATSGTLLGVNFTLDLLSAAASVLVQAGNESNGNNGDGEAR